MKKDSANIYGILVLLAILTTVSCRKTDNAGNDSVPFTPETPHELSTTNIAVYVVGNDQVSNPLQMFGYYTDNLFTVPYQSVFESFHAGPQTVDKYLSHFGIQTTRTLASYEPVQYKGFNVAGSSKNYVNFRFSHFVNVGNVANLGGPTNLALPGKGSLQFPENPFDGSGRAINYSFYVNYLDPSAGEFALNLPSLPFADYQGRRQFLHSYGVYQINPLLTYCDCNVLYPASRFAKEVKLQMPIPLDRIGSAPDSIETWHMNLDPGGLVRASGLNWKKSGMAYKKNGFYETITQNFGAFNFAKPKDAVYVTIQLRTSNDMALPNTRFVIKNTNTEITEGRTDMDGNAMVLLPVSENLSFNIINDHFFNYSNIQLPDQNLGSFSQATVKKLILADRHDVGTLEGKVYNCDGTSFGNGKVLVSQKDAKDDYVVPIVNGKFKTANWLNVSYSVSTLTFIRATGDTAFKTITCLGSQYIKNIKRLNENFYTCPNAESLYCNFEIDGQPQTISGNVNKTAPMLTAKPAAGSTAISMLDGSKGVSFSMYIISDYFGSFSSDTPLMVNGIACKYASEPELTIYRNDAVLNGIMEGWFAVDYLDANNRPHKLSGNFRIKIVG